jgi:sulfotransferase family protein
VLGLADNEDRLLWIFGSSRSGSTWLLRMLAEIEGVVPIDDPHLGHHLGVWRPIPLAWSISEDPEPELKTLLELKAEEPGYFFAERHREIWREPLRALISARFGAQAEEALRDPAAARAYVVKEPGSHVAPFLLELFPASKLVFLLRDGRDVVDSWLAAYRRGSWAIPGGAFPVARAGRIDLIRWLASVWAYRTGAVLDAFRAHPRERRLLVRYEEMREQPADALAAIAALLELDAGDLEEIVADHAFERLPDGAHGPLEERRLATPGSWREHMSRSEQAAMHDALGDALAVAGYGEGVVSRLAA